MPYKKSPAKKPLVGKQKNLPKELKEKILKSPSRMNSYDKDMMHERELISDAEKQEKTGGNKTKSNDKKLIYDAEKQIHNEDVAKKKHMHVVNRIAGRNSR
jgi:hypothetical protein